MFGHFKSEIKRIERAKSKKAQSEPRARARAAHRSLFAPEPDQEQGLRKSQFKTKSRKLKEIVDYKKTHYE